MRLACTRNWQELFRMVIIPILCGFEPNVFVSNENCVAKLLSGNLPIINIQWKLEISKISLYPPSIVWSAWLTSRTLILLRLTRFWRIRQIYSRHFVKLDFHWCDVDIRDGTSKQTSDISKFGGWRRERSTCLILRFTPFFGHFVRNTVLKVLYTSFFAQKRRFLVLKQGRETKRLWRIFHFRRIWCKHKMNQ